MNRFINLLPIERRAALTRAYHVRLGVVAAYGATSLVAVAMIMLFPSYLLVAQRIKAQEANLAAGQSALAALDDSEASTRFTALTAQIETLSALSDNASVIELIHDLLAVDHTGVALAGFVYTAAKDEHAATIDISGVAETRDSLRSYQRVLEAVSVVRSVNLPVSAYAQDVDIAFASTLTLEP